ncbi:hypothetical protein LY28_02164 [Ruminiclostridium sufflavum DSM 19573]|uniref:Cyclic nucleotide-binding domain-containing protein n=1 Tax=Ruminiclostridium sufflavum DSM 19573 TaxID=1121337 RepID=A0A318XJS4_9FIRM|nr:hypothetical protein [Ruminiclostridium sufflavum]PYG87259.1 hypothetical protein LY28_02164 [Ruminiclostridium sufflavum DSM 19573]
MGIKSDFAGQYSGKQDEILMCEGGRISSILLLLNGKIDVYLSPLDSLPNEDNSFAADSCRLFTLDQNTFLCVNDIIRNGQGSFCLKAKEACNLYCFPATSIKGIKNVIASQKDYSTYIVSSLATLIDLSYNAYQKLLPICRSIDTLTRNLFVYYWAIKDKYYFQNNDSIEGIDDYQKIYEAAKNSDYKFFPLDSESLFVKYDTQSSQSNESEMDTSGIEYFSRLLNVPIENRKGFFNSDDTVCEYHIQKGSDYLDFLTGAIKNILASLSKNLNCLYLSSDNLIGTYGKIIVDSKEDKEAALNGLAILKQALDILTNNIEKLQNEFNFATELNIPDILGYYDITKEKAAIKQSGITMDNISDIGSELPQELENSTEKILKYCSCSQEVIDSFNKRLSHFRSLKDKTSGDSDIRELRASLSADFFSLYEKAFKKSQQDDRCPRLISMFLNYGYMDERLLTKDQAIALYRLCDKDYSGFRFSVCSAKEWLEQIYKNKKEPSINDFGQDYSDMFRDMKKRKIVTDLDRPAYDNDYNAKLSFEINNMLKTNQKVCHGQMSTYFPILHKDLITRDIEKAIITPQKINNALEKVLETDFSIFYREIWYKNETRGIEKEPIMKEILPDIILVPTFGSRGSMWQEITGRARNTPGRFILPAFTDENIPDLVMKLIGTFRWELCRTMMGISWNDITEKSLTSEYTDYIQFYKKNHDLSEDAKAKIKVQIQKNRNLMKDIFTSDYETWINYESKGILRLNKIARSILFRYCPLPKEIRSNLAKQPAFSDLVIQLNNSWAKTAKSLSAKYSKLFKDIPLDEDLEANLIYYRDM